MAKAQTSVNSFTIIKPGTKYSKELVQAAFAKANMCGYFFENKPNDIVFDDGTIVRLYSKKEFANRQGLSDACFKPDNFKPAPCVWSVAPSAVLVKGYTALLKKPKTGI